MTKCHLLMLAEAAGDRCPFPAAKSVCLSGKIYLIKAVGGIGLGTKGGHTELEEVPTSTQEAVMMGWKQAAD